MPKRVTIEERLERLTDKLHRERNPQKRGPKPLPPFTMKPRDRNILDDICRRHNFVWNWR